MQHALPVDLNAAMLGDAQHGSGEEFGQAILVRLSAAQTCPGLGQSRVHAMYDRDREFCEFHLHS